MINYEITCLQINNAGVMLSATNYELPIEPKTYMKYLSNFWADIRNTHVVTKKKKKYTVRRSHDSCPQCLTSNVI